MGISYKCKECDTVYSQDAWQIEDKLTGTVITEYIDHCPNCGWEPRLPKPKPKRNMKVREYPILSVCNCCNSELDLLEVELGRVLVALCVGCRKELARIIAAKDELPF